MEYVQGTLNRVELLGWLGADPDMRLTPNGAAVCTLRLATKRTSSRNAEAERTYATDWTTIEVWGRLAERCYAQLRKGQRVLVSGSLRTDSWDDRDTGQRRSKTFVRAEDILFLTARSENIGVAEQSVDADDHFADAEIPF